jgi:hypothetical protein
MVLRQPLRPVADPVRAILIWPDVNRMLDGTDQRLGFPDRAADRLIGQFIAGHYVSVSQKSAPGVDLERLERVDEVWVLCFRAPRPGWRLMGRFIEPKVFVGLKLYERGELGAIANYTARADDVIKEWNAVIEREPFRSPDLGAYVGGVFNDVDQPQD